MGWCDEAQHKVELLLPPQSILFLLCYSTFTINCELYFSNKQAPAIHVFILLEITLFEAWGNKNVPKAGKYCCSQCIFSIVSWSLRSLAKPVSFMSMFPSLNHVILYFFTILISPVLAWCGKLSMYAWGINFPGILPAVLWTCTSITIMSYGPTLIKPAHILLPFASHCSLLLSFPAV